MKKLTKSRLALSTETVRSLSLTDLGHAGGGLGLTKLTCVSKAESCAPATQLACQTA